MVNWKSSWRRAVSSFAVVSLAAAMLVGSRVSFSEQSYAADTDGKIEEVTDVSTKPIDQNRGVLEGTNLSFDVNEAFEHDDDGDGMVSISDLPDADEAIAAMEDGLAYTNRLEYAQKQWDKGKRPQLAGPHTVSLPYVPGGQVVFEGEDEDVREKTFEEAGETISLRFIPEDGYQLSYVDVFTHMNHVNVQEDDLSQVRDGVLTFETVNASMDVNAMFTPEEPVSDGQVRASSSRERTTFGLEVDGKDAPLDEALDIPAGTKCRFYFGFSEEAFDSYGNPTSPYVPGAGDGHYLRWNLDGEPKYSRLGSSVDGELRDGDWITYYYDFDMPESGVDFQVLASEQWEYGDLFGEPSAYDVGDSYFNNNGTLDIGNTYEGRAALADDPGAGSDGYEWFGVRNLNLAGSGMADWDYGIRFSNADTISTYYPGYAGTGDKGPGTTSIGTLNSGEKIYATGSGGLRTYQGLAHCLSPGKPTPFGNGSLHYTCIAMTDEGLDETGTRWGWAYFWAYVTPDSGEQDGGFYLKVRWRIPNVGIDIMKYDANPTVSALSDCYSLGGAVFGVYSDARCTRLITSCATDSTGHTYICAPSLSTGTSTYTYYIKEISPSPGYLLNDTVYSVRLHVGESMSSPIRVPEEPIYHDPDIRIYKKDATTGRPTATGAGTLGGAEFTIKYYDNVDGRTTGTPDRTWVVRTNETGVWNMNTMYNSHKVSGDPWFMSGNTPVLPAGTYTFQETKAPVGYVLNTQVFKEIVKADDYDATSITVFQDPEVPETPIRGGFKMQKFEVGGNAVGSGDITMAGAVYEIVNNTGKSVVVNGKEAANGAVCYTFTTGSTGAFISAFDLLPYGSYTIREKTPPAGMLLSGNKLSASFTITTNGQMADLTTGQLADPPMRGDVKITKENARISGDEGDASLSGITFTVYNRSARAIRKPDGTSVAPGGVVTTLTTSIVDGKAVAQTTGGMLSYGTYGIKETATNNSYQLTDGVEKRFRLTSHNQVVTLDASGNALVAKNVPILGGFEFQKYNKESGKAEAVGDATLGGGVYEIVNRSAHDVVVVGNRVAPGNVCFTFTTDTNGHYKSAADLLPYGSYTIREKTAPLGFTLKGKLTEDFQIRSHGAFVDLTKGAIANELIRGDLELVKKDAQTEDGSSQGDAELEGIEFVVKNASGKSVMLPDGTVVAPNGEVARIVTKYEDGRAIAKTEGRLLSYGTYTVQEVATNDSYLLTDGQPKTFQIRTDSEVVRADVNGSEIVFKNQVVRGGIQGGKGSHSLLDYNGALGDATLEGARLAVRNLSNHPVVVNGQSYGTGEECLYVTTDVDGHWTTGANALPYGTYEIREKDAPVGYQVNPDWVVNFQIREDGEMIEVPEDEELYDEPTQGGASFGKNDIEFGLSEALGGRDHGANSEGSHLDGIVFRIFNASKNPVINSEGELCMPGDPVLDIVTEWREDLGRYAAVTTDIALSYGTYKVQEYAQDRDGSYQIVDKEPRTFQIREKSVDTVVVDGMECTTYSSGAMTMEDVDGEEMVFENQVTRGDFSFTKVAGGQAKRLSVPFKLTNVATGESHLIVTDKNGMFSSETAWVKHSQDTNANDAYLEHGASAEDAISMSDLNMRSGVWFGKGEAGSMSEANDELGALPYGEYLLEELHSDTNAGYEMQTFAFYVYNHGATVDGGTITDNPDAQPEIHTAAVDPATGLQEVLAEESTTIVDNVSYVNLKHGEEYEIRGILMDKETGRPINIDGKRVESTVKFRAAGTQGTVKVEYTFNALSLKGKTLVVFEDLYKDGKKILSHSDIDDADQTITFPEVQTHATDEDGEQDTGAYEEVTITDRVSYSNLVPGKRYVMKGKLMVKEKRPDGSIKEKPLLDADGNAVEEEVEFVPETPDGTVDVVFVFDGSLLAGKTIVAFEELQQSGVTIGVHMDIEDADQTLVFPKIGTQAREQESGSDEALAGEETSIIDKVSYDGLLPGREYTLSGTLMDKQTKKPVVSNGKEVTASTKFTASASGTGFVELTFTFDASDLGGHTTVVFEELYRDGRKLAWHTDIQDDGQTITFPDVHTTAMDTATGGHGTEADKTDRITDRVFYTNLVPGREYSMTGTLMKKSDGTPLLVDGQPVTKTVIFVPEAPNGYVDLVFDVDTSLLAGDTIVAFEELKRDGFTVGVHMDLEDEDQSVHVHQIGTQAWDQETQMQTIAKGDSVHIIDRVRYIGLEAGKEYALRCVVMDRDTGKAFKNADREFVTGTLEFVAEDTSGAIRGDVSTWGYVDVELVLDSTELAGRSLVLFEYLVEPSDDYGEGVPDGTKLAKHTDLSDEGQTLYVPEIGTQAKSLDGSDLVAAIADAGIVDTIAYKNLVPGQSYRVSGVLMDRSTGKPLAIPGMEGNVTAETVFVPETPDGEVTVEFSFDASGLKGLDVVVFEELYVDHTLVADHKDIEDEGQTVKVPGIGTQALSGEGHKVVGSYPKETIVDTVKYEGLVPGLEYELVGVLYDQVTGQTVTYLDETGVETPAESSVRFTPSESDGYVEVVFSLDASQLKGHSLVVLEELFLQGKPVADHKDTKDEGQTVYVPEIGTQAHNGNGVKEIAAGESTVVVDTVSYRNLVPGLTYMVHGKLMDRVTKLPVAEGSVEFVPETSEGTVDMEFVVDTRALEGHALVAFEYLEIRDVPVASHEDLEDEGQTVYVPKIGTKASGAAVKTVELGKKAVVKDVVEYTGLEVGKEHVMRGRLLDKQTGEIVANAEVSFVPESSDGSVELFFELDTRKLTGHTFVALEELLLDGDVTGRHENPDDEDQTVYVAKIGTKAYGEDGSKVLSRGRKTLVYDDVMYENLVPGQEYLLRGVLVDQETEEAVASAEHSFVCGKPDGSVTLTFTVDTRALAGRKLVAFEELYGFGENGEEVFVGKHKDLEDLAQTVSIPEIGTTAYGEDGTKEIIAADEAVVVDTVEYHGLVPEEVYVLEGVLMDQATGKPVVSHGLEVTASKQFVPEESDGFVDVLFGFDASALAGRNLVVFERLYMEGGKEFARHEDLEDEGQTVTVVETPEPEGPWIGTRADNGAGSKNLAAGPEAVVVDVVSYKNLTPGQTYRLEGVLIEKGTGAPVVNGSEETPVASAVEFAPESADGEVEVRFVFDASEYAGADLVVFEKLYLEDEVIATHEDIEDEEQTVYVELPPDAPTDIRIGTKASGRDGNKLLPISEKVEIVDVVSYTGLEVGTTYRLDGELMDQESNASIGIYGETTFTPDSPDGEIEVVFTLDTRAYAGKSLVVFERLYSENTGRRIATHEDIEDEGQTVTVDTPDVPDTPDTPDTGLRNLAKAFGVLALISICLGMAVFGVFVWRKRR